MRIKFVILIFFISGFVFANPVYVVSIAPYKGLLRDIAGPDCKIVSLLREGQDPHSFEFKPSTIEVFQRANVYFTAGTELEMEIRLLDKLKKQYPGVLYIDTSKGITRLKSNPHVWVSLLNLKIIATNIKETLLKIHPHNKDLYIKNYNKVIASINVLFDKGKNEFLTHKHQTFVTYHPAFIYFASDFGLIERSIEDYGRAPSARDLQEITKIIKDKDIKAMVIRKGVNRGVFESFIERNNLTAIELDHLGENYLEPLAILVDKLPKFLR